MFRFVSLTTTTGCYSETILHTVLRWIVLVEVFQNAWSFSVFSHLQGPEGVDWTASHNNKRHSTKTEAVKKSSPLPYPWRTSERDHNDEHRLEDIFLDEISDAVGPDDNYHFRDGTFQYLEEGAVVDDSFVARNLEVYGDEDEDAMLGGEQDFPSSLQDH